MSLCRKVSKADIVRVFSFSAIATLVRMLTGLVSVKIIASIIGPVGVALVGQLNNFATIAMTISSGGINAGVTKYVSEYKNDNGTLPTLLSTALRITFICSLLMGLFMILFHEYLSNAIMLSPEYGYVFVIFGITVLFYSVNALVSSIVNGFKEFKTYVKVSIAGSILGLCFTVSLVLLWGVEGALISAVTFQSVMLFVTLWMIRKLPWLRWSFFKERLSIEFSKRYFRYTLMALTSAATVPVSQLFLRGYVISEISAVEAGWWEAMNRISNMYLMIITTSFSVYYLPRLSELSDVQALRHEIYKSYKVIIPMLLGGFSLVYLLRIFVIRLLFTPDFVPMEDLFLWQLLGDFFKIGSWLIAYLMTAKSMTRLFVVTEVFFSLTFVVLGILFMQQNGVVGITQGYFVNYVLYALTLVYIFRKLLFCCKTKLLF